jgi:hypothetical protein
MMFALPQSAGGFPSPMAAVAPHTAPIPQTTFLDTKTADTGGAAAEPEGLDSPSEFALFAAATSSFGFLPSTFDLAVSPVDDGSILPPQPASSTAAAATVVPEKRLPTLSLRTDFFAPSVAAPRSRSQPPPASPADLWLLPSMPPRYGNHHSHRHSHAAPHQQRQQQGHQYRRSHHHVPTGHFAAQAPPTTSSSRSARHSQTYPGPSSASTPSLAPPTSAPPSPPQRPSPPKLDDLLAALVASVADGDGLPPPDDELPDYATSQAEAHALHRDEAARRARELEEGWLRGRRERARGRPWRAWDLGGGI